jgi:hypothetical protein
MVSHKEKKGENARGKSNSESEKSREQSKVIDMYLTANYYDTSKPASYSGLNKLWSAIQKNEDRPKSITRRNVEKWLEVQQVHRIHKTPKRHFKTESIIMGQVDEQWDGDLISMIPQSRQNKGFKYIALFVDLFSKYIWLEPLKTKQGKEVTQVVKKVFTEGRKPQVLRTDQGNGDCVNQLNGQCSSISTQTMKWLLCIFPIFQFFLLIGTEFKNKILKLYLDEEGVKHYFAYSPYHANYAERCVRTVKSRLFKHFTKTETVNWLSVLDDMADSLNSTVHSTTKMAPKDISIKDEREVYEKVYLPVELKREKEPIVFKFRKGDKVHISSKRGVFEKGYTPQFSQELFVIAVCLPTHPVRYRLKDLSGEVLLGSYYEAEMLKALVDDDPTFIIDKVIRRKNVKGEKQALIQWKYYSKKFNSWIPESEIHLYK